MLNVRPFGYIFDIGLQGYSSDISFKVIFQYQQISLSVQAQCSINVLISTLVMGFNGVLKLDFILTEEH